MNKRIIDEVLLVGQYLFFSTKVDFELKFSCRCEAYNCEFFVRQGIAWKGEHIKHKDIVDILEGNEITVEFDRPTALQIDGETILGVTSYTATLPKY